MNTLLITYDLHERKDHKLLEYIRTFDHVKLSKSAYAIRTERSPTDIYAHLCRQKYLLQPDQCYIITLQAPWRGDGPVHTKVATQKTDQTNDFLRKYLK
jgi:hypothetical protein